MSSIIRRAGSKLIRLIERSADPGATPNEVQVYPKDVSGTSQLFAQDSAGTVHQLTPSVGAGREILAEVWAQNDVAASQTAIDLSAQVSQLFDNFTAVRAGSIVGLVTRFSAAVTAGTATLIVSVNGTPGTLSVVSTSASNQSGGQATQATGIDTFVAGDNLAIEITTDGLFAPVTTDVEAYLEIDTQ